MKYKEFHRLIRKNGWTALRTRGSHILYIKESHSVPIPVPFHTGEIPEPLRLKIVKEMGLK